MGKETIKVKDTVRLLGVILDRKLTFSSHIKRVIADCTARLRQVMAVSGTDWGSATVDLRALHIAYIRSKLLYCSPVFTPLLSTVWLDKLDIFERKVLRVATGCSRSTPTEDIYLEANIPPLRVRFKEILAVTVEKHRRMPAEELLSRRAREHVKARFRFNGPRATLWATDVDDILRTVGITPARLTRHGNVKRVHAGIARLPLLLCPVTPPWRTVEAHKVCIYPDLIDVYDRTADAIVKRDLFIETLEARHAQWGHQFAIEAWTSGFVEIRGPHHGVGSAAIWRSVAALSVKKIEAAGANCTQFHAHCVGVDLALKEMKRLVSNQQLFLENAVLLICTTDRAVLQALNDFHRKLGKDVLLISCQR